MKRSGCGTPRTSGRTSYGVLQPVLRRPVADGQHRSCLVTDKIYYEPVWKRNFRTYHRYFVENKKLSALAALQGAINAKRAYTCAAIERAVFGGLLVWDKEAGTLSARRIKPERKAKLLDEETTKAGFAAEKIGEWFAGETPSDICVLLGVRLT